MSWGFLALPIELQNDIVGRMFPVLANPKIFFAHAHRLNDDTDNVFDCINNLRNFALTCKDMFVRFIPLLFSVQKLKLDNVRVLITEGPGGSLHPMLRFVRYLALGRPGGRSRYCTCEKGASSKMEVDENGNEGEDEEEEEEEEMDEAQLEIERNKPLDPSSVNVTELERSIANVYKHFASVILLDLTEFPLSLTNLWNLAFLKDLQTLSIRNPRPVSSLIPNVRMIHRVCTLPLVTKLNIEIHQWVETEVISNVVKLFEHSIQVLSVTGITYEEGYGDVISAIFFNPVHMMRMPNLRHINIDLLEFDEKGIRGLVSSSPNLETILVDCRGIDGFLPLFYAIDLIRIGTREPFDTMPMMKHEQRPDGGFSERVDHYSNGEMIWDVRMSKIYFRFEVIQTPGGSAKVLDTVELLFGTADGDIEPINTDMTFRDLVDVFRARASTFRHVKRLTLATEGYESVPHVDISQLKEVTSSICRDFLPLAENVKVRWGEARPFRWTPAGIEEDVRVKMWTLFDDDFPSY